MNYWEECIEEAFKDTGVEATKEQVECIAGWVEVAHENYGMAHGNNCIPNPLEAEVNRLKQEIKRIENVHSNQLYGIKKGVAERRNVDVSEVSINEKGRVTYTDK